MHGTEWLKKHPGFEKLSNSNILADNVKNSFKTKLINKDIFDTNGKMTGEGKEFLTREIKRLGLPEKAKWDEFLEAMLKNQQNSAQIAIDRQQQLIKNGFKCEKSYNLRHLFKDLLSIK